MCVCMQCEGVCVCVCVCVRARACVHTYMCVHQKTKQNNKTIESFVLLTPAIPVAHF